MCIKNEGCVFEPLVLSDQRHSICSAIKRGMQKQILILKRLEQDWNLFADQKEMSRLAGID